MTFDVNVGPLGSFAQVSFYKMNQSLEPNHHLQFYNVQNPKHHISFYGPSQTCPGTTIIIMYMPIISKSTLPSQQSFLHLLALFCFLVL